MGLFMRAIVYGFGFSLGAALYKRMSTELGIEKPQQEREQPRAAPPPVENTGDGGTPANAHA